MIKKICFLVIGLFFVGCSTNPSASLKHVPQTVPVHKSPPKLPVAPDLPVSLFSNPHFHVVSPFYQAVFPSRKKRTYCRA